MKTLSTHITEAFMTVNEETQSKRKVSNGDVWYSNVNLPGFEGSMIKAEKGSVSIADALLNVWLKNKTLPSNLTLRGDVNSEEFKIIDSKSDKDYKVTARIDLKDISGNPAKSKFISITRVG